MCQFIAVVHAIHFHIFCRAIAVLLSYQDSFTTVFQYHQCLLTTKFHNRRHTSLSTNKSADYPIYASMPHINHTLEPSQNHPSLASHVNELLFNPSFYLYDC